MDGSISDFGRIELHLRRVTSQNTLIATIEQDSGEKWARFQDKVNLTDFFIVVIDATVSGLFPGVIAVDDIQVGPCDKICAC